MEKERKKHKNLWKMVVLIFIFFGMLFATMLTKDLFEHKLDEMQFFDMRLYLLYFALNIVREAIGIGVILFAIMYFVFVLLSYWVVLKKDYESIIFTKIGTLIHNITKVKGMLIYGVVILLVTLFWPIEEVRDYRMAGENVSAIKALEYQIKDLQQEPVKTTIENYRIQKYTYEHTYKGTSSRNTMIYLRYERDGEEYVTPCTLYIYGRLLSADMAKGQALEVYLFPNTGMIVDFAEVPLVLKEEPEQLQNLLKEYGYPYGLKLDEEWKIMIVSNVSREYCCAPLSLTFN